MSTRLSRGLEDVWLAARRGYGYLTSVLLCAAAAVTAIGWRPRAAAALALRQMPVILLSASWLSGYLLLYAWISQAHGGLPRLILALFLPLVFGLAVFSTSFGLLPRRGVILLNAAVLVMCAADIVFLLRGGILTVQGGS